MKVFLGGTCNKSIWRDKLIPKLSIDYFNPVVEHWDEEAQEEEIKQRENCDIILYVITPKMKGVYSIAEIIDDSNKRPEKTVISFVSGDGEDFFDGDQISSLKQVGKMAESNGAMWVRKFFDLPEVLNNWR